MAGGHYLSHSLSLHCDSRGRNVKEEIWSKLFINLDDGVPVDVASLGPALDALRRLDTDGVGLLPARSSLLPNILGLSDMASSSWVLVFGALLGDLVLLKGEDFGP